MSLADYLAEETEAEVRWHSHLTTAQPQSLVNVANHFRNVTEMIGKDDHFRDSAKMVGTVGPDDRVLCGDGGEGMMEDEGVPGHTYCLVCGACEEGDVDLLHKEGCAYFSPPDLLEDARRAVIDAAKAWANASDRLGGWKREESAELLQAVRALEAEEG